MTFTLKSFLRGILGKSAKKVPSLKDFLPLHPLHLLEKKHGSGVTWVEFRFIIITFFKASSISVI